MLDFGNHPEDQTIKIENEHIKTFTYTAIQGHILCRSIEVEELYCGGKHAEMLFDDSFFSG